MTELCGKSNMHSQHNGLSIGLEQSEAGRHVLLHLQLFGSCANMMTSGVLLGRSKSLERSRVFRTFRSVGRSRVFLGRSIG